MSVRDGGSAVLVDECAGHDAACGGVTDDLERRLAHKEEELASFVSQLQGDLNSR